MDSNNKYYGGISATGLLGVVFVTLKLLKVINWSWWWVTAPFWGPIAIILVILLFMLIAMLIKHDEYV